MKMQCSEKAKQQAYERAQAKQKERSLEQIARLKSNEQQDPQGIWGDLYREAAGRFFKKYGELV